MQKRVLMLASVASMIDQFNMPNIQLLLKMGCEVCVACNFKEGNTCDRQRIRKLQQKLEGMHAAYFQWDCPRRPESLGEFARAYVQLCRLFEECHFAWIHCQSPVGGVLARMAAHKYGVPVLYMAHGFHFYHGAPVKNWLLYYPAEKLLAHWTDVLVTINEEDGRFARRHLRAGRVEAVAGVGIDTKRFQMKLPEENHKDARKFFCQRFRIPENAVILLSVGELTRRKNHQAVIRALAGIEEGCLYYMISGQGELREELQQLADSLGIGERVCLTGFVEDVETLYQNADLFVFPSLQEGFPVALMEAMACGLPCAVSDIRGNRELIDSRGGCLFEAENIRQIQKAVLELAGDTDRRGACGQYNCQKVQAYRIERIQKHMHRIYRRMDAGAERTYRNQRTEGTGQAYRNQRTEGTGQAYRNQCAEGTGQAYRNQCTEGTGRAYRNQCTEAAGQDGAGYGNGKLPQISVVMAVYQVAGSGCQELVQAVGSIRRQTFKDWELLICDDGSTDGTWNILKWLEQEDPRIRLLRHAKNHGAAGARNACIRESLGRYIAVMDADDISAPDRLEKQYVFLEKHSEYAFVGSRGEFFVRRIGDDGQQYWHSGRPQAEDFLFSLPYVHASMLFRKEAFELVHGYDSSRRAVRVEDYDLLMRMYAKGLCGANLGQTLYYIRRDRKQYKRRKYRYRFHEAYVKYRGFRDLALMPAGYLYAAKPLAVGLLPARLVVWLQGKYGGGVLRNCQPITFK